MKSKVTYQHKAQAYHRQRQTQSYDLGTRKESVEGKGFQLFNLSHCQGRDFKGNITGSRFESTLGDLAAHFK